MTFMCTPQYTTYTHKYIYNIYVDEELRPSPLMVTQSVNSDSWLPLASTHTHTHTRLNTIHDTRDRPSVTTAELVQKLLLLPSDEGRPLAVPFCQMFPKKKNCQKKEEEVEEDGAVEKVNAVLRNGC